MHWLYYPALIFVTWAVAYPYGCQKGWTDAYLYWQSYYLTHQSK